MLTIKIREVRGSLIEELAKSGELVGITSNRVLVGVLCPITQYWLEHLVEMNFSRLQQNLAAGEDELSRMPALETLDEVLAGQSDDDADSKLKPEGSSATSTLSQVDKLIATAWGLFQAMMPGQNASTSTSVEVSQNVRVVRIGDLSAAVIESAGKDGQMISVTNGRVPVGIIVPVTERLVEHLVEQKMSRVMFNIARGEKEIQEGTISTLEQVLQEAADPPAPLAERMNG